MIFVCAISAGNHDPGACPAPDPEPIDVLALATKASETVGLLTATRLLLHRVAVPHPHPKGTLT